MAKLVTLENDGTKSTLDSSTLGGTLSFTEVELDFGTSPVSSKTFNVIDATIIPTDTIIIISSNNTATGRIGNDWEFDMPFYSYKANIGNFDLSVVLNHLIVGKRKVKYIKI